MSSLAEAVIASKISQIQSKSDPNMVMTAGLVADMRSASYREGRKEDIACQVQLNELIDRESAKDKPNTIVIDAWQKMVTDIAVSLAKDIKS